MEWAKEEKKSLKISKKEIRSRKWKKERQYNGQIK
jgi:hypothetical protein